MKMKIHERKKLHYISDYAKAGIYLALGLAICVWLMLDGKNLLHGLLIGSTAAMIIPFCKRMIRDFSAGYRRASK